MDLLLITCVKTKLAVPAPAKDIYVSALFKRERGYAERKGVPWFILSAEYGLVRPDDWLAPYERHLPDTPRSYRDAWGAWVVARLVLLEGDLTGKRIEVHASSTYVDAVAGELSARGAVLLDPLGGLAHGERLAWYDAHSGSVRGDDLVSEAVKVLGDESKAVRSSQVNTSLRPILQSPGLYSWWVDGAGANDLSVGLGNAVAAGLIYAGQAGATRTRSGKPSAATLWSRLTSQHIGGNTRGSTFRRTLAAVLASPLGLTHGDDPTLNRWMESRLRVATFPMEDGVKVAEAELAVLNELDPPLNLRDVPITPLRESLTRLRRQKLNRSE